MIWTRLVSGLWGCRHAHRYRERRPLAGHGPLVLHLVCQRCGDAVPAMPRSVSEHAAVVAAGRPRPLETRRGPATVRPFVRRG